MGKGSSLEEATSSSSPLSSPPPLPLPYLYLLSGPLLLPPRSSPPSSPALPPLPSLWSSRPALALHCRAPGPRLGVGAVSGKERVLGGRRNALQNLADPHVLGNDLEEGVSVSSVIENKWTFGAANLLIIHDTGGGDTEVRGSGDRIARDESGTGFIQGPRNLFWSKPFSCSFALEEGLNIWQSMVFFGLAFLTALHCGGLYTSGFGARFSGSRAHLCCFPAT